MSCLYIGTQECFVCNHHLKGDESAPEKPLKCLVKDCGRFYHLSCLSSYQYAKIEGGSVVMCPLHVCETCASEEKNLKDPKSLKGEHPTSQFVLVICRLRFNICDVHTLTLCWFACRTHVPLLSLSDGVPRGRHVHRGRLRTHHQQSHHLQQTLHKPERAPRQRFLVLRLFTR